VTLLMWGRRCILYRVGDDVDWIVEGTHPLAGYYQSKVDLLAHTFLRLDKVLPRGA
jgi:hypothetical protein